LDAIHERNVIGRCVISAAWRERIRYVFAPGSRKPQRVVLRRGVEWTHWPAEKILSEPGVPIRESDRVVTQRLLTGSALMALLNEEEGYNEDAILALVKGHPHLHGSPGAEVQADKESRAGVDPDANVSRRRVYDVRTLMLDAGAVGSLDRELRDINV